MDVPAAVARLRAAGLDGRLDALCARHGVRVLTLHGSARRASATARDVDVAALGVRDPVALVDALMVLTDFDDVDLLVLDDAPPVAGFAGLVEAEPLFEDEPGRWARAQMAAALEYYDTEWLRELELEALRR